MTSFIGRTLSSAFLLVALIPNQPALAQSTSWVPVGPDGGDARSFAADPPIQSTSTWEPPTAGFIRATTVARAGRGWPSWPRPTIYCWTTSWWIKSDPKTLLVGTWVVDHPDGGLFISHDAGKTWTAVEAMKGQSIRALTQAPSDPKIVIAGTLKGVFPQRRQRRALEPDHA